jgi:hypothetical protein
MSSLTFIRFKNQPNTGITRAVASRPRTIQKFALNDKDFQRRLLIFAMLKCIHRNPRSRQIGRVCILRWGSKPCRFLNVAASEQSITETYCPPWPADRYASAQLGAGLADISIGSPSDQGPHQTVELLVILSCAQG